MRLVERMPAGSGCVFRQSFWSLQHVLDAKGVPVAVTVDKGINPTGASGRVTYKGTESIGINQSKMTLRARIRTGAVISTDRVLIAKTSAALNDNQWFLRFVEGPILVLYVASSASDLANQIALAVNLSPSTEYICHFVYDGTLAPAQRGKTYLMGAPSATSVVGTIPVNQRASASPVTVFNWNGGAFNAPNTSLALLDFAIWDKALSASEVLRDTQNTTYLGVP